MEILEVAVFLKTDLADGGVVLALAQRLGDSLRVVATGAFCRLTQHLHRRITGHDERAVRVLLLRLDGFNNSGVFRSGRKIHRHRRQYPFRRTAGNGEQIGVIDAVRAHEHRLEALIRALAQNRARFRVETTPVHKIHIGVLQLGNQRGKIALPLVHAFNDDWLNTARLQIRGDRIDQSLAIRLLVVQEGDVLRLDDIGDVGGAHRRALQVGADGAQDGAVTLLRQLRRSGRGGNHHDAVLVVNLGGGHGGRRTEVADDELHAVINNLVGDRHRLLRLAGIVVGLDDELLAVKTAIGVQKINRGLGANLLNRAVLRDRAGFRAGEGDGNRVFGVRESGGKNEGKQGLFHDNSVRLRKGAAVSAKAAMMSSALWGISLRYAVKISEKCIYLSQRIAKNNDAAEKVGVKHRKIAVCQLFAL